MTAKLILTHGLPGSGKDTWADQEIAKAPETTMKVNRDDIRTSLFGAKYHDRGPDKRSEDQVSQVHQRLIREGLASGKTVIVSDTNLNTRFVPQLSKLAQNYGAEIGQQSFDVPVAECKRRNQERAKRGGRLVPESVIDGMASKAYSEDGHIKDFVLGKEQCFAVDKNTPGMALVKNFNDAAEKKYPFKSKAVVLLDIDGTLANNSADAAYAFGRPNVKKDFPYFYKAIAKAPANSKVRALANKMRDEDDLSIVVMTGRDDSYAKELLEFIDRSGAKVSRVIVKREGDFRPDSDFKHEQLQLLKAEGLIPVHSIDDRPRSIAVWEREGIMVSRVDFMDPVYDPANRQPPAEPSINTVYGSGFCIRCGSPLKTGNIGPKCRTKA